MIKVKNIKNSPECTCSCKIWIKHWEIVSKQKAPKVCSVSGCTKPADVGGHVKRVDINDNKQYIVPICKEHNNPSNEEIMELKPFIDLVLANKEESCEKLGD